MASSDDKNFEDAERYFKFTYGKNVKIELHSDGHTYARVGKARAGHMLDGKEHFEFPKVMG